VCHAINKRKNKMKKIIIGLAIAFTAAVTQAAAIDWQVSLTGAKDSMDKASAFANGDMTAYIFEASVWNGFESISEASFGQALDSADFVANGSAPAGKKYNTAKSNGTVGARAVTGDWTSTLDAVIVLVDNSGASMSYTVLDEKTLTVRGDQEGDNGTGKFSTTLTTVNSGTWADVPEPTSGLLLLLGVAGLALKRKRA
jgi:hypothetical protein